MDFVGNDPLRCDDVCEQLCRGGTAFLVLGIFWLACMVVLETVSHVSSLILVKADGV